MALKNTVSKNWRDAATLIIASAFERNSYKILMLKRSSNSKFMPNAYVFPGGVKDAADFSKEWKSVFKTYNKTFGRKLPCSKSYSKNLFSINERNDGVEPEIGFRITALRETFEESGILIATNNDGENIVLSDPVQCIGGDYGTLQRWRDKVYENPENFLKLFHTLKSSPAIEQLYEWSSWLTPQFAQTKRFNTIFYVIFISKLPCVYKEAADDDTEIVELQWDTPLAFLQKRKKVLPPPQVIELSRFERCARFTPNLSSLFEWSNWLTPTFHKKRFHTRFFVCFLHNAFVNHSQDNVEIVNSVWLKPQEAIRQFVKKEITLQIPQIYENNRLMKYLTFDDLKKFAKERERLGFELWCPHRVDLKDGFAITYPGDDYHHDDPNADSTKIPNMTLSELREKSSSLNRAELYTDEDVRNFYNNTTWHGHPPLGTIDLNEPPYAKL